MTIAMQRGGAYIRETAPGLLVITWYPHRADDPVWPGIITEADQHPDFPYEKAMRHDTAAVRAWLAEQPWTKPLMDLD